MALSGGLERISGSVEVERVLFFTDAARNTQNVWHEASDYSSDQIMFQTGTMIDQKSLPKDTFKVMDRKNKQIWSTPMDKDAWQNFAFTLDFNKK